MERSTSKPCTACTVAESNAHASARERKARHASMECSQPDLRSLGLQRQCFHGLTGLLDVVNLTGLSATPPQDLVSVTELWTPQALAMKREKTVSTLDLSKSEATLKRQTEGNIYSMPARSSRRLTLDKSREPVWTETRDNRYQERKQLHEEVGKYFEQAGAVKMKSICLADLLLRSSICFLDMASADAHHILGHLQEGLPSECSRWSDTVANQVLRVHSRGRCFAWDR